MKNKNFIALIILIIIALAVYIALLKYSNDSNLSPPKENCRCSTGQNDKYINFSIVKDCPSQSSLCSSQSCTRQVGPNTVTLPCEAF